jgi:hypothetical protein
MPTLMITEAAALKDCELVIEKGMATFVEVGQALGKIRDGRLYRDSHKTFAAYVKERWGKSRDWADTTIKSAGVVERIENADNCRQKSAPENAYNCTQKPATESQARELAKAPEEEQPAIWAAVVEEHGPDVTAAKIAEAVEEAAAEAKAPDPLAAVCDDDWWRKTCATLRRIAGEVEERCENPLLRPHMQSWAFRVTTELKKCRSTIAMARPDGQCWKCKGKGCGACFQTGLLTVGAAKSLGGRPK